MKKRYYLSMLSIYLFSLLIDTIYAFSHKSMSMFFSMTIPNLFSYGFINLIGAYFLYKPIDRLFCGHNNIEQAKKRIDNLTKYSTTWSFFVGVFSGFVLLISVFIFGMADDVSNMELMPPIYMITVIPSTLFTMAILPSFFIYFIVNDFTLDLKTKTFLQFKVLYTIGKVRIGRTLFFILFILSFFPILINILDLIATSTVTLEEYSQLMSISYIETTLNEQYIYLLGVIFAVIFIPRSFTKPIYSLLEEVNKVSDGDYSSRTPIIANNEIGLLTQNFNSMVNKLETSHHKQLEYSHTLEKNVEQLNKEIIEREQAEELARQQQKKLFQSEKMASVGILVSGVAHEVNNPNNFILLNSDNLADVWEDIKPFLDQYAKDHGDFMIAGLNYSEIREEVSLIINGIKDGSERIKKIVQTLKDFARTDPGNLDQMVDIMEVVDASVTILASLIKKSTDRFSIQIPEEIPQVKGNFQQIEQVLINLISNACHALEGRDKKITLATIIENDVMVISVQDEGIGVSKENLKHIMDPFFTTKRDTGGTGLGLSISYNIVKEHGGELLINSEVGKGTTVTIKLPV